jgi:iron complex transport system permease protein
VTLHRPSAYPVVLAVLGLGAVAAFVLSLCLGSEPLSLRRVSLALFHPSEADQRALTIVHYVRIPRTFLAFFVGMALAVSGMVMQGFFQNPMADPYLLGVSSGASLGATAGILVFPPVFESLAAKLDWSPLLQQVVNMVTTTNLAFIGALLVTFVVYILARVGGRTPVTTLLLTGIAIGSLASALSAFLYIRLPNGMQEVILWMMGSFQKANGVGVAVMAATALIGLAVVALYTRDLNVMLMGDETAQHLGVEVERVRRILLVAASFLAATAVALVGIIGFVGLVVPNLLRLVTGPKHERLLPTCVLAGGALTVLADVAARLVYAAEVPVGIVTAFIGCPFFLFLLRRTRRGG